MSSSNKNKTPFALSKKLNRVVGVDEVERGLKCECICIGCGMELMSKQGEEKRHHFAHHEGADESCNYSYWVSIRDLAKQLLRESKYIWCSNFPKEEVSALDSFYELELFGEEVLREKHGADIIFSSAIGLIGIYFLTGEKRDTSGIPCDEIHQILEMDLRSTMNNGVYTVDMLRNLVVLDPVYKKFVFNSLAQESDYRYGRLYRAKSIIDVQAYKAMGIAPTAINSFGQSDFSAINTAKSYYLKMYELFKRNKQQDECKELNVDKVHRFYQFHDGYYAVALIRDKYYVYESADNKIVFIGSGFDRDEISKIIRFYCIETIKKLEQEISQKKYPALFNP